MQQSFLGRIRLHLQSAGILAQTGHPFGIAPAAYGFFPLHFGGIRKGKVERNISWAPLCGPRPWNFLPGQCLSFPFHREGSAASKGVLTPRGSRLGLFSAPALLGGPTTARPPHAVRTQVTSSRALSFTVGTVSNDLVDSTHRNVPAPWKVPAGTSSLPRTSSVGDT